MSNLIPEARIYETEIPQLESVGLDRTLPPLRRNDDGLIDFDFYLRKARAERAAVAVSLFTRLGAALARFFQRVKANDAGKRSVPRGPNYI